MSKARLVITAVVLEGRCQAEIARTYGGVPALDQPARGPLPSRGRRGVRAPLATPDDVTHSDRAAGRRAGN
jgi:transposase InsO family protein